jgi:putative DNA primase/helicase
MATQPCAPTPVDRPAAGLHTIGEQSSLRDPNTQLEVYRKEFHGLTRKGRSYLGHCCFHNDAHPSVRVDYKDGGWVWYCDPCQKGGGVHTLLKELGKPLTDVGQKKGSRTPVATYSYVDANGNELFQALRFEYFDATGTRRKTFQQRRRSGSGEWIYKVPADVRTLYNLAAVLKAATVLVLEGEKDCETAMKLGFVATTNPMGAGKWTDAYSDLLHGKDVIVVPDADTPGRNHAQQVCRSLQGKARSMKLLELPDVKDLTEWVERGGNADQLKQLLGTAPPVQIEVIREVNSREFPKTDLGNAERLVADHGDKIRYCPGLKKWLIWDEKRWAADDIGAIFILAKQSVRLMQRDALDLDDDKRRALVAHGLRSESDGRINAMVSLAETEPGVAVRLNDLDAGSMLLNTLSGTLDLQSGELRAHRREDLVTKIAPVEYDPNAVCPTWLKFLEDVTAGNPELSGYLQRAVGYALTGLIDEHALFLCFGTGANGKTTFLEAIRNCVGEYAQVADFSSFTASRSSGGPRNDLAKLQGARFVTATESEDGKRMAEGFVKQVTGGDRVTARFLYSEHFEFKPQFKVWLATNHKPSVRGTDEGIWRRIRLIPFTVRIPDGKRDRKLPDKLLVEAPGILRWAVQGLTAYQSSGLLEPSAVTTATTEYRNEQNVLEHFLEARCAVEEGLKVQARELFVAYKEWSSETEEWTMNERKFSQSLTEHGFTKTKLAHGAIWKGVALLAKSYPDEVIPF